MSARSPQGRLRPVQRFLGPDHAGGGPFSLLGVTPEACSEDLVLAALDRQIERLAQHPECDTPEADEVRLALHAAAAQLLDPVVRRHLISRWNQGSVPAAAAFRATGKPSPRGVSPTTSAADPSRSAAAIETPRRSHSMQMLEHDAILAIAMCGGWNGRALRRLISLAHARGLQNDQVVQALRNLSNRRRSLSPGPGNGGLGRSSSTQPPIGNTFVPGTTTGFPGVLRTETSVVRAAPDAQIQKSPVGLPNAAAIPTAEFRRAPASEHPGSAATAPAGTRDPDVLEEQIDPATRLLKRAALLGGVALLTLVSIMVLVYLLTIPSGSTPPASPANPSGASPETRTASGGEAAASPGSRSASGSGAAPVASDAPSGRETASGKAGSKPALSAADPIALIREVASLNPGAEVAAEDALLRFSEVVPRLASLWPALPPDRLISVNDAILEFLYRISGSTDLLMRAIDTVAAGARPLGGERVLQSDEVLPAAWSSGLLVRLSRERDLPATAKLFIDRELAAALGPARPSIDQTFESGLLSAMYLIPQRLIPDAQRQSMNGSVSAQAWKSFLEAAASMPARDPAVRTRVVLMALEVLLVQGPEPNEDREVAAVITEVIGRLPWRAEDESRRWVLRWFADPRVSNADLNTVTSVLATRSGAEGIDLTMVLSTSAASSIRADLRERYGVVWSLEDSVSRDALVGEWVQAARGAIAASFLSADDLGELASAALLARLNEAATWHWRGDAAEAAALLTGLHGPVEMALSDSSQGPSGQIRTDLSDGAWAERYLAARQNIKFRRELLAEMEMRDDLGMIDAEVLVREAMLGSPADLRLQAQRVATRFATSGALLNAVLEWLPRAPQIAATSSFVESIVGASLPSIRDAEWGIRARRILVERLLEAVAEESPMRKVDRLGRVLRVSYRSMGAQAPLSSGERDDPLQPPAAASAAQVWRLWRAAADNAVPSMAAPVGLESIERKRAGRQGQAQGMVQEFAAEQVSLAELLAYLVSAEQPGRIEEIQTVLADLASERRRSKHINRQINAAERAIAQLWLIRLGQPLAETES